MTEYVPGSDHVDTNQYNPRRGAGGQFATYIQGATPKFAVNSGTREIHQINTMARLYIRIDLDELQLFKQSIGDSHTQRQLIDRLIGDPANPRRQNNSIIDTGYMDFNLQQVDMAFDEKVDVSPTNADNFVAYYFGQAAPRFNFSGILINSKQDDQHTNWLRLYMEVLRGTALARRGKLVSIKYDSFIVSGSLDNHRSQIRSGTELIVPFSFTMLVKKLAIVNYTQNWVPTRPGGRFAADPLAVPYDGRPSRDRTSTAIRVRIPPNAEEQPGDYSTEDPRANQTNPQPTINAIENSSEDPYIRDATGNPIGNRPTATTSPTVEQSITQRSPQISVMANTTSSTFDQLTSQDPYVRDSAGNPIGSR